MTGGPRKFGSAAVLLALGLSCAGRQQMQGPTVKSISIEGNHALPDRKIKAAIATRQTGWWPFAAKRVFDPVVWETDLRRIVRFYQTRGYYNAEVVQSRVETPTEKQVKLDVEVREGQPTRVAKLALTGLEALPAGDRSAVVDDLPLVQGGVFTEPARATENEQLASRLREHGYPSAKVHGEALVDRGTKEATLAITAQPGPRYSFGDVRVDTRGGKVIQPLWIWDEVRQAIPEGARYSEEDLAEARRRVVAMGDFGAVKVTAGTPDPSTRTVPVLVETEEAPFHTLRLGGGVRMDQIRDEGRAIAEWTNRDFLGGMRRLTAHVEAGWAFIPNLVSSFGTDDNSIEERNGPVGRARLAFEQPRLFGKPTLSGQSSFELTRTLEQTYDEAGGRLSNGVSWRPRSALTIIPSYHLEGSYLNGATPGTAFTAPLTLGCNTTSNTCFVWLSYLEESVIWDRRDDPLEPRRGFYAGLSLQEGGGPLGGDFKYVRFLPEVRGYHTVGAEDGVTLAARLRVGQLYTASGSDSAVVTRFYSGGAFSMRGFNERRLSPLLLTSLPPTPSDPTPAAFTVPIGGNGLIDGSFEVRWPLERAPGPRGLRRLRGGDDGPACRRGSQADALRRRRRAPLPHADRARARRLRAPPSLRAAARALRRGRDRAHRATDLSHRRQLPGPLRLGDPDARRRQPVRAARVHRRSVLSRLARGVLAVVASAVAVAAVLVVGALVFLRTPWGGELLRGAVLSRVNAQIVGHLDVGRLTFAGDSFRLEGVELRGPDRKRVARIDSVGVVFSPFALLRRHVLIKRLVVERPVLDLAQDAEGLNLTRALRARVASAPGGAAKGRIEIRLLRVAEGSVVFRPATGPLARAGAVRVDGSGHVDLTSGAVGAHVHLDARVAAPLEAPLVLDAEIRRAAGDARGSLSVELGAAQLSARGALDARGVGRLDVDRIHVPSSVANALFPVAGLRADVDGQAALGGAGGRWQARLDLAAAGGNARVEAEVDVPARRVHDLAVTALHVDLGGVRAGLPVSDLSLLLRARDLRAPGGRLDDLEGELRLLMKPGTVAGLALGPGHLEASAARGTLSVSGLHAELAGASVDARGTLAHARLDARLDVRARKLGGPARLAGGSARVGGDGRLRAHVTGTLAEPAVTLDGHFATLSVGGASARGLTVAARWPNARRPLVAGARVRIAAAELQGRALHDVAADLESRGRSVALSLRGTAGAALSLDARGDWRDDHRALTLASLTLATPEARWAQTGRPIEIASQRHGLRVTGLDLRAGAQRVAADVELDAGRLRAALEVAALDLRFLPKIFFPGGAPPAARIDLHGRLDVPTRWSARTKATPVLANLELRVHDAGSLLPLLGVTRAQIEGPLAVTVDPAGTAGAPRPRCARPGRRPLRRRREGGRRDARDPRRGKRPDAGVPQTRVRGGGAGRGRGRAVDVAVARAPPHAAAPGPRVDAHAVRGDGRASLAPVARARLARRIARRSRAPSASLLRGARDARGAAGRAPPRGARRLTAALSRDGRARRRRVRRARPADRRASVAARAAPPGRPACSPG